MKIIIKNLKQVQYNVEIESDEKTIKDLKNAIEAAHGFDSNLMKLLHNGVILDDSKTLKDYNIKEENVVIMMNSKAKPKVQPNPPQPETKPQELPPEKKEPSESPSEANKSNFSDKVNSLVDMGYEKEKVEKALNAANGNLDLAIEYLSSGNIPERIAQTQTSSLGNNNNNSNLPFELKKNASIMKIVCQRDPNKIISILNNMKDRDPTTLNLIKQHEEEFKRLLVSPISQEDITIFRNFQQELRARRTGGVKINLTKEESEAVKRLQDLGNFSKSEVLQAFIACDKNEELTANYLFEQKLREEDEANKNNNNNNQGHGQ
jgi:UV excision repair protein RAD23